MIIGLSSAAVAGIVLGITVFICIIMLVLACFIKRLVAL